MNVKTINTASINAISAVATADANSERATLAALPVLRAQFKGWTEDDVRATVQVNYASVVGVELKVQGSGRLVWPADAGTAKRACNRLIGRIIESNDRSAKPEALEVPAHVLALARKLVAACGEYEEAARLLATAVAKAKAN